MLSSCKIQILGLIEWSRVRRELKLILIPNDNLPMHSMGYEFYSSNILEL
jgi:hypothetical protein